MIAKSVNGAGRMLNCAQPGLSRALKHMESKLGFTLFHRSSGKLAPTQEAMRLFEEVQLLYKDVERVDQTVRQLAAGGDDIFRLGAPPSLGHSIVPVILRQLRKQFKDFNLHFDILPREQVTDYILFQRGEYALTVYGVNHPNILSEPIGKGRMVGAVHAGHPLASSKKISVKAFAKEHVISFLHDTAHARAVRDLFNQAGVELHISTFVSFAETATALVEQELGIAIVDEFTAMQVRSPNVRLISLVEEAFIPVYINHGRFSPRSVVGDAFEAAARRMFFDTKVRSVPRTKVADLV